LQRRRLGLGGGELVQLEKLVTHRDLLHLLPLHQLAAASLEDLLDLVLAALRLHDVQLLLPL